jgi:hypothetical protein
MTGLELVLLAAAGQVPAITEVMANPLVEDSGEYVEIFNPGPEACILTGFSLTDGDALDQLAPWEETLYGAFPATGVVLGSDTLPPGGVALVFELGYPSWGGYQIPAGTVILTTADASICNGLAAATDPLTLFDGSGTADSCAISTYGTPLPSDTWSGRDDDGLDGIPFDPGDGFSVERIFASGPDLEYNWAASPEGGTPGVVPQPSDSLDVCLCWLEAQPAPPVPGQPFLLAACVLNCGALPVSPVQVAFFLDADADSSGGPGEVLEVLSTGDLQPGQMDTLQATVTLDEGCWLAGATASQAGDTQPGNDTALLALVCGGGSWPVISEVLANPADEDRDEYFELWFPGPGVLDATSLAFTDGDALDQVEPWSAASGTVTDPDAVAGCFMPAGTWAVVLDSEYASGSQPWDLEPGTLVLTTANTTLGDGLAGTDPLTLYKPGGPGTASVVSTWGTPVSAEDPLSCDDDGLDGIPFDPGQGTSVHRIALAGPDEEGNWSPAPPTPGGPPGGIQPGYDIEVAEISLEPPMGPGQDAISTRTLLLNAGTEALEEGQYELVVFADLDMSGTPGSSEIIYQGSPDGMGAGDSLQVLATWTSLPPPVPVRALVSCASDTTPGNDSSTTMWNRTLDLVVNEIMYGPQTGQPEWIELFNAGQTPLDLRDWSFRDSRTQVAVCDSSVLLQPSSFAILTSDSSAFADAWPGTGCDVLQPSDWPVLNDQTQPGQDYSDDVRLLLDSVQVCDWVPYDDSWGGGGGISLERISPVSAGYLQSSWAPCGTGGTPGAVNGAYTPGGGGGLMSIHPDPFSPDGDGFDDLLVIELSLPGLSNSIDLLVFNVQGRLVATLFDSFQASQQVQTSWDGGSDSGDPLPVGRYIVYLRADPDGGEVVEAAKVVVLARRL